MKRRMSAVSRREQILHGAMDLFALRGFRGTTTREIAQHLGISEALMFKYFPSKEALYRSIIRKRMYGSEDMLFPKEAIQAKDDRQVFRAIASYLIRRNTEDPTFMRLVLYSALEGHGLSKIFFENNAMENTRVLAGYIRQRIQEKAFKKVPALLAARAFIGMVLHYIQSQEIFGMKNLFQFSHKKVVDTFVDAFLTGLNSMQEKNELPGRKNRK
ncbi:MAG: TetR/AcrR family transcriptional regulator [Deltaproteobacteria bacterium]|jgi:AcrR family transcriptional regulator|nr:TetR/AcrR family transcriptional regulator [Deltaproteobacteria bacterium]